MSHLKRVEGWRDDVQAKIKMVGKHTDYGRQLQKDLEMYEKLLVQLREAGQPKQKSLLPREPGDESEFGGE